jgi:hypothetical protein
MSCLQAMKSCQMKGERQRVGKRWKLPQEMLQSVRSFKPLPNEQTISVKEPRANESAEESNTGFRLVRSGMFKLRIDVVRSESQSVHGTRPHPGRRSREARDGSPN